MKEPKYNFDEDQYGISLYLGFKGLKKAFDILLSELKEGDEYKVFALGKHLNEKEFINFFSDYHKTRESKKINVKLISDFELHNQLDEVFKQNYNQKGLDVRYSRLKLPNGVFILNDKVMFVVPGKPIVSFVVICKNIADEYKSFFEEVWQYAYSTIKD